MTTNAYVVVLKPPNTSSLFVIIIIIVEQLPFSKSKIPFNINILLCGCPLYDNETNREIFDFVHKFIVSSRRFD